ncbi:MAG TPA: hypothetical protein ENN53_06390, partial [Candidatus Acetothermia bacterium]|nr:hypothetical protein [Candidatus Acetothermia bacterium]
HPKPVEDHPEEEGGRLGHAHPLRDVLPAEVAKERRRELEEKLKAGEIPAIVATGSLELGIDMGLVDLVCQVESPHGVARGLQRVGRAGHLYRAPSRGRLLPKTRGDLLEMAALARAMRHTEIADVRIPRGCLDILAQQIVAIVAGGEIRTDDLLRLVRRAYPFHDLPRDALQGVVRMLSEAGTAWDRVHDMLHPLPGGRRLAVISGGAIPDTGQYGVYTEAGERTGELDEEFVYEARVGETLVLGTNRWRILDITHDWVVVGPGEGPAKIPFWKGEAYRREVGLGRKVGELAGEIEARLDDPHLVAWLQAECALDRAAAENLVRYVGDQHERADLPTDRTLVIEGFPDEAGGSRLAVLTPYGRRFHLALRLAILARFREELGIQPDSLHGNSGILFRITQVPFDRAVQVIRAIRAEDVGGLVLKELANSPLFGLRFRENAGRTLLLPRDRPGRRTPLWLRRLTARDLLETARARPGFPIVTETYREILADFLPMGELRTWLRAVDHEEIQVAVRRGVVPSPFAASLLWEFQAAYLYQWDKPKPGPPAGLAEEELASFHGRDLAESLDLSVVERVERGLRGIGEGQARTAVELLAHLHRLADVTLDEVALVASPEARAALPDLLGAGTLVQLDLTGAEPPERIVPGEDAPLYRAAQAEVVRRHVGSRALARRSDLRRRYPFPEHEIESALDASPFVAVTWRGEKAWTRRETPERLRQLTGAEGVAAVLTQIQGITVPWALWDREILPTWVEGYRPVLVEELLRSGEFLWLGRPRLGKDLTVAFAGRDDLPWLAKAYPRPETNLHPNGEALVERLTARGASFLVEIAGDLGRPATRCAALL